jgi:hypothetical protein
MRHTISPPRLVAHTLSLTQTSGADVRGRITICPAWGTVLKGEPFDSCGLLYQWVRYPKPQSRSALPRSRFDLRGCWFLSEDFLGDGLDLLVGDLEEVFAGFLR